MLQLLGQAIGIFCWLLELCILLDIVLSWLPKLEGFKLVVSHILDPLFSVIQYLMKYSIFTTNLVDLTPFIALILVSYIQTVTF